jgi:hypothetical protein
MVAANAAMIAIATIIAKISKVIWVRRRWLQLRSLFMDNTSRGWNQRSCGKPVPPGLDRVFRPDFAFDAGHFRNGDCRNMLRRACQMWHAPAT